MIINCPRHIKLLAMSATVKNPDDLGGWIAQVRRVGRVLKGLLGTHDGEGVAGERPLGAARPRGAPALRCRGARQLQV